MSLLLIYYSELMSLVLFYWIIFLFLFVIDTSILSVVFYKVVFYVLYKFLILSNVMKYFLTESCSGSSYRNNLVFCNSFLLLKSSKVRHLHSVDVLSFKSHLSRKGCLYWFYYLITELQDFLSITLSIYTRVWLYIKSIFTVSGFYTFLSSLSRIYSKRIFFQKKNYFRSFGFLFCWVFTS